MSDGYEVIVEVPEQSNSHWESTTITTTDNLGDAVTAQSHQPYQPLSTSSDVEPTIDIV